MKKVMFAAALAATGMTFAATPEAQVYDVTLSIKTTAAASATINNKTNPFLGEEKELVIYRKQASKSWKGLIWGCNCEAIDGVWEEVNEVLESDYYTIKGCIIWDTKTKQPVYIGNGSNFTDLKSAQGVGFGWDFLNAIDKNGKKVEGVWTMVQDGQACEEDFELFNFKGAGFGTLCLGDDCTSYVKSISGNFAGKMKAPTAEIDDNWSGCVFCGYKKEDGSCEFATAWEYCDCDDYLDEEYTAAYGTWSVKYNSGLSQKLSKPVKVTDKGLQNFTVSIRDVYNFKGLEYVAATIAAIENTFWEIDPTGCTELCEALVAAKKVVAEKEAALDAVSYENLKAASEAAKVEAANAEAAYNAAVAACSATNEIYVASTNELAQLMDLTTNSTWSISYMNKSGDEAEISSDTTGKKTLVAFAAANEELKGYTLTVANYNGVPFDQPTTYAQLAKFVTDKNDKTAEKKAKVDTDKANLADAEEKVVSTKAAATKAADDAKAAENNLLNYQLLQYKAEQDLEKAQALEAAAQKAYDDAGCND